MTVTLHGFPWDANSSYARGPALAPGVSHPEPGGLSTREVLGIISALPAAPLGADIVELNPERDINMMTAQVAARFVKELAALMAAA